MKRIINRIRMKFGLYNNNPIYENDILQYERVLQEDGSYIKIRNCSQYEYDNILDIYDDVTYLINVPGKEGTFKVIPSLEIFLQDIVNCASEILDSIKKDNKNITPQLVSVFHSARDDFNKDPVYTREDGDIL